MSFNARQFWSGHEFKKWVVTFSPYSPTRKGSYLYAVTTYVRARTEQSAIRVARANTHGVSGWIAGARLATPFDLGCR